MRLTDTLRRTEVFDAYWRFAVERQNIFFKRLNGDPPPWTDDPILRIYKFTNAYRASDRTSQYLIRNVIYSGPQDPKNLLFRILIFKLFNKIETWELLSNAFGEITFDNYRFESYNTVLLNALAEGRRIYSAAYIMPSGKSAFGYERKHANHLKLIEQMISDNLQAKLGACESMKSAYERLCTYPCIGPFLGYQLATDINYSTLTDFRESEFVVAGPGAIDGISKCFVSKNGYSNETIIRAMYDEQDYHFNRLGLSFKPIGDRKLQLIDCQNLFCEIGKYARVAFPKISGLSGRARIKQIFQSKGQCRNAWYPPKWEILHV
jgi:hypothetical protein